MTVSKPDLAASFQAIQEFSADKEIGNLKGRKLAVEIHNGREVLVYRQPKWYEPIQAFFGRGATSSQTILKYCQKHPEVTRPEIESIAKSSLRTKSIVKVFSRILQGERFNAPQFSGSRERYHDLQTAIGVGNFEQLAKLCPSTNELRAVGFSSANLFKQALEKDLSLAKAMISATDRLLSEAGIEPGDTLLHTIARRDNPELLEHAIAFMTNKGESQYPFLLNAAGKSLLEVASSQCKKMLQQELRKVIVQDLVEYKTNPGLYAPRIGGTRQFNPQQTADQIITERLSQEYLLKWAVYNNKLTTVLALLANVDDTRFPELADDTLRTLPPPVSNVLIDSIINRMHAIGALTTKDEKGKDIIHHLVAIDARGSGMLPLQYVPKLIGKVPADELASVQYGFEADQALIFYITSQRPSADQLRALFDAGLDLDHLLAIQTKNGETALHYVCENSAPINSQQRHLDVLKAIIEKSKDRTRDLNFKSNVGYTPLHFACRRGNYELAKLLLEQKEVEREPRANPMKVADGKEIPGQTPLQLVPFDMRAQFEPLFKAK